MNKKVSVTFMLAGILFTTCLLVSNLISSKIISIGPLSVPAGVIIFPLAYILNDVITEVWGFGKARLIIWSGFAMNLIAVIFYTLAVQWPAASFWSGQESFSAVLGSTPRIAIASLTAYLFGSFVNAFIMSKFKLMTKGKGFTLRAIVSTLAGEGIDSLVFITIAFVGIIPVNQLIVMVALQAAVKTVFEIVVLPLTVVIVNRIKTIEETDAFDVNISYNPFKVNQI
ncbi:conserved hypothetical integral membrane protein [Bacteroidales bacterium 6E]|nr:conserved hypothetical integral membrane protein [Bacteroidales bacterium 6E]